MKQIEETDTLMTLDNMDTNEEKPRVIFKVLAVALILMLLSTISYFTWKPLIIPFLILFSGYGSTYFRNNLIYGGYPRPVVSGIIWGIFLSLGLYYLLNLTHSPFWWELINYVFGFLAAGYIGYRSVTETAILKDSRLESFYVIAQFTSIILYILSLSLLHLIFSPW
ncbi:MAG: hypothetical protein KGQ83_11635 [Planctomycetes bacterium]|nr:hypothetical protein [Planctomycetota bacterium]